MRFLISFLAILLWAISCIAQAEESPREFSYKEGDTTYTMKKYVFCLLNAGPNRFQSEDEAKKIQEGHMAHLNSLAEEGILMVSGPFENGDLYRGLLIFDLDNVDQVVQIAQEDPAVQSGRLSVQCLLWWGAKGTTLY